MCQCSWGPRPNPRHCKPVERSAPAGGGGIRVNHSMPRDLFQGHSCPEKRKVWPRGEGLAAGRCDLDPVSAALPRPPWDSAMEPVLKRSHMKQPQRRHCRRSCHMPQEPLKLFQWDRGPALECIQAVQHRLSTCLREACFLIDRIQFHTDKRDPLRRGEFALFPVDPKAQLAEVREHQVPVFAQLVLRLRQYEPVVEVVENANALFSQGKGLPPQLSWRHGVTGTARRAGPCTNMPVLQTQTTGMACGAEGLRQGSTRPSGQSLQANLGDGCTRRCTSAWVSWTEACPVQDAQIQDWSPPTAFLGHNEVRAEKPCLHIGWRDRLHHVPRQ